jgi:hypothetical protein
VEATGPPLAAVPDRHGLRPTKISAWAHDAVRHPDLFARLRAYERWAALTVGLSATQQTLLGWVAHHPLLPRDHLAYYLELPAHVIDRLMVGLRRCSLVRIVADFVPGDRAGPRYLLTVRGAGYLAARDGVPVRRYLQGGVLAAGVAVGDDDHHPATDADIDAVAAMPSLARVRLADLRRHPEHTIGVQYLVLALAREAAERRARGTDCRVLIWMSAAEGQEWFRHTGRTWHILPDARLRLRLDGTVYDLLVEWDRGLVRRRDYGRKLASYAAYFADRTETPGDRVRLVLITTETAIERVRAELVIAAATAPRLLAATRLLSMAAVRERRIVSAIA